MLKLCSSIIKKSRWCYGPGTRVEDKTERCERYRRSLTQNLLPQLDTGSKRVCPVLDEEGLRHGDLPTHCERPAQRLEFRSRDPAAVGVARRTQDDGDEVWVWDQR